METLKNETENVTKFRDAMRGCTTFADADRRLAHEGMDSAGRRRMFIAKHAPKLFNQLMTTPYTGRE